MGKKSGGARFGLEFREQFGAREASAFFGEK